MFLSRFGVKRYKCLGDIDVPLTPIHVLIGENDAGKTSLLEAMAAFCASSENDLREVFPGPWDGRELVLQGRSEPSIELWGEWEAWADGESRAPHPKFRYGMTVDFPLTGPNCSTQDNWIEVDGERRSLMPPGSRWARTSVHSLKRGEELPSTLPIADLKTISSVLKPAHKYALDPKLMAIPAAFDTERRFMLGPDGFGLGTLLDDILSYEAERFIHLRGEFCRLLPQFRSVRIMTEMGLKRVRARRGRYTIQEQDGKGVWFETQSGQTVRAEQASDGAILLLGFLALAHLPDPPNLLLIEEPENGIYPTRLRQVIELLKDLVHRTEGVRFPQIILSTHSPFVLSLFKPEEVTFLSRQSDKPDAPVRARPLRDAPNIEEMLGNEFYLGELWYNMSEKELFGES